MGQNYMTDPNVVAKIIESYNLSEHEKVLEIGPGFGAMTTKISERCGFLWAIEKDPKSYEVLESRMADNDKVRLLRKDFLDIDICSFVKDGEFLKVVGNIPYSVSSMMVEKTLKAYRCVKEVYFVMQKELVDRIIASPGTRAYSRLSVLVQYYAEPKKIFKIKQNSFYPVPKVESALIRMKIHQNPPFRANDEELFFLLVNAGFSQRRKKVLNSIATSKYFSGMIDKEVLRKIFIRTGIDLSSRAEQLSIEQWRDLSDAFGETIGHK